MRGFADGFVSVLLAQYLSALGFSPVQIGAIVTATLLGSAVVTLAVGMTAHRYRLRSLLLVSSALMVATGLGFMSLTWFWPLLIVAAVGTLNPSAGDVSVFLPVEQAFVATEVDAPRRPYLYAFYNLAGIWAGAIGALLSGLPEWFATRTDRDVATVQRASFVVYVVAGVVIFALYRRLRRDGEVLEPQLARARGVLRTSRRTVGELAALFSLDSAGGGFVITSLLVLWLNLRFDLAAGVTGAVFFAAGALGGLSQLLAPRLARRFGLVRTMSFTHIPANVLLILTAFAPTAAVAIALLLARSLLSQLDVPARQSFVMAIVPPEERAAAASVTNVPRSLAAATTPLLGGMMLDRSTFGWPPLIAGVVKLAYDLLLLGLYRNVPEEAGARRVRAR
ncbi:MAG: MFS transporter [Acidimicrobiia bacterium]